MKISEIQKSHNLQFASNNIAKVKRIIVEESPKNEDSFVKNRKFLSIPQEVKSRIEKQIRKFQKKQTYDKFNALQKEKDLKYKNMPD